MKVPDNPLIKKFDEMINKLLLQLEKDKNDYLLKNIQMDGVVSSDGIKVILYRFLHDPALRENVLKGLNSSKPYKEESYTAQELLKLSESDPIKFSKMFGENKNIAGKLLKDLNNTASDIYIPSFFGSVDSNDQPIINLFLKSKIADGTKINWPSVGGGYKYLKMTLLITPDGLQPGAELIEPLGYATDENINDEISRARQEAANNYMFSKEDGFLDLLYAGVGDKTVNEYGVDSVIKQSTLVFKFYPCLTNLISDASRASGLSSQGNLPQEQVDKVFSQMLDRLDVIHQARSVHRDVKPANFLGDVKTAKDLKVYIIDLDMLVPQEGNTKELGGTPEYFSPWQLQNKYGGQNISDLEAQADADVLKNPPNKTLSRITQSLAWALLKDLAKDNNGKIPLLNETDLKVSGLSGGKFFVCPQDDLWAAALTYCEIKHGFKPDNVAQIKKVMETDLFLKKMFVADLKQFPKNVEGVKDLFSKYPNTNSTKAVVAPAASSVKQSIYDQDMLKILLNNLQLKRIEDLSESESCISIYLLPCGPNGSQKDLTLRLDGLKSEKLLNTFLLAIDNVESAILLDKSKKDPDEYQRLLNYKLSLLYVKTKIYEKMQSSLNNASKDGCCFPFFSKKQAVALGEIDEKLEEIKCQATTIREFINGISDHNKTYYHAAVPSRPGRP